MIGPALTFAAFWALVAFTASAPVRRARLAARRGREWLIDVAGLLVQGVLVPIVGAAVLGAAYVRVAPGLRGALHLPWPLGFLLAFVGVDYLYYWNHRLLHTRPLWPVHAVHHTAPRMDVFVTSRNTLWTSVLIVYLWAGSLFAYVLADPSGYLAGAALTSILDLTRHSPLRLPTAIERALGALFVLPRDHALHHANLETHGNYGANLVLWDRLHGTYLGPRDVPEVLGVESELTAAEALFWPIRRPR
jgi:sterol desaturase/sphingolipid hydroxylase (fatty acid hydroxylase superfamily)